jgi:hypothetical protein
MVLGTTDYVQTFMHQLLGNAHCAVAPDDQQHINAILLSAVEHRL